MTYITQSENTQWRRDNLGHYIEMQQGGDKMDVSVNFHNLLDADEQLDELQVNTTLQVDQKGIFFTDIVTKRFVLALMVFNNLDTLGTYAVDFTVRTTKNRRYKRHFRVKVV